MAKPVQELSPPSLKPASLGPQCSVGLLQLRLVGWDAGRCYHTTQTVPATSALDISLPEILGDSRNHRAV